MFKDKFGRAHTYLRISLTDQCNFRCLYCMPDEDYSFLPGPQLMSAEEIESIAKLFVEQGVDKIRLTGGEPLVRRDFDDILIRLSKLPVEMRLTTNGVLLDKHLDVLKEANLKSINVSLDTLQKDKFYKLTKRKTYDRVWNNVQLALKEGFEVKLNVVAMHGINEDEVVDFVQLLMDFPLSVRFIEFMPFDGNHWHLDTVMTYQEILAKVADQFELERMDDDPHSTSKNYRLVDGQGSIGIISTVTDPFCSTCNRLRLTADGKIRNCLFARDELNLLGALRNGGVTEGLIQNHLDKKAFKIGGLPEFQDEKAVLEKLSTRSMIKIGG